MHDLPRQDTRLNGPYNRESWWRRLLSRRKQAGSQNAEQAQYLNDKWGDEAGGYTSASRPYANTPAAHNAPEWGDAPPQHPGFDAPHISRGIGRGRGKWWWFKRLFGGFTLIFLLLVIWLALTAPLSKSLQPIAPPQITLTASDGTPIARNGAIVKQPVKIKDLPPHVVNAFLAIEDRRFYGHVGVDPRGFARAAWNNVSGGSTQGGSTITQQLAKFTFLSSERTMTRKARELLIAFWLEARLSKDEILERYLSNVYFGDNVYGLRAASLHYFYRQPEKLKPEQAVMLAGLVQAPSRLAPTRNLAGARKRAQLVRNAMVSAGFITQAQADALPTANIDVRTRNNLPTGTYFADWAMPEARRLAGGGYGEQTLQTTLDARLQDAARRAVSGANLGKAEIALVAMRPNGEVVAMIGGRSYAKSPFNRVTQAKRQPGSTFKLFVWLAALRDGLDPDSIVEDTPITTGKYQPKNAKESYAGNITLQQAFAKSSNVVAVRLFQKLGDDKVIDVARDFGITSPLERDDPSLALGTSSLTLLELTAAYAGVAGNSYPVVPHAFVTEEKDWFETMTNGPSSLNSKIHSDMQDMLRQAINGGTGRAASLSIANYGKTGTSQDNRDALFVGYAGGLVVGVWVGNDDNTPLKGIHGGSAPARIWRDFMQRATGARQRPAMPKPKPAIAPTDAPVEPLDLPELPEMPEMPEMPVDIRRPEMEVDPEDGVTIRAEVEGMPLDVRIGEDGIDLRSGERERRR